MESFISVTSATDQNISSNIISQCIQILMYIEFQNLFSFGIIIPQCISIPYNCCFYLNNYHWRPGKFSYGGNLFTLYICCRLTETFVSGQIPDKQWSLLSTNAQIRIVCFVKSNTGVAQIFRTITLVPNRLTTAILHRSAEES